MNQIFNIEDIEKKILLILRILKESPEPMGARIISRRMLDHGVTLSERGVRYHLKLMDNRGLTRLIGRHDGRAITEQGIEEIGNARVHDKIGFAISRIEILAFRTSLDLDKRQGLIPVNVSFFPRKSFKKALELMKPAFGKGLCVSELVACADEGERIGELPVPMGYTGFATVCSIVVNGILLKNGVPMDSRFGGILQVKDGKPLRFAELIHYSGSSLDPSEVFIRGRMTSVRQAVDQGEGKILANFREIPVPALKLVDHLIVSLRNAGIGGVLAIGEIGEPICQIPVDVNRVGMILYGGLNPVACAHETGVEVENRAMSTVMEYQELQNFGELCKSR
ncbi:MAG: NrpR regulatory domain-containing protein [Deltaproteobacteria bacterium]|nr:NrpR regulatory domain-containing protein [Deltaproteobacteria bacterium]